jgi:transposase
LLVWTCTQRPSQSRSRRDAQTLVLSAPFPIARRRSAKITAITLATEFGTFRRFEHASEVMSYTGLVPSEHSSGAKSRRGKITKTGNSHLRRVLVESAWHYRHRPHLCLRQRKMQQSLPPKVAAIAWRAQERLHRRHWLLSNKSKPAGKVVTALARELVGFIWAIGTEVEAGLSAPRQ